MQATAEGALFFYSEWKRFLSIATADGVSPKDLVQPGFLVLVSSG
ncbi:hypothetical protein ACFSO0_10420 [Brevibacillus sp. GCM10020057]